MNQDDPIVDHEEVFVALQHAVLNGFFEHSRTAGYPLTPLASDILIRMEEAYREAIAAP